MPERFSDADLGLGRPLLAAPLGVEARLLRKGGPQLVVRRIGIGPRRAAEAGQALGRLLRGGAPQPPVLLVGFGGSLTAALGLGEVVVGERVVSEGEGELPLPSLPGLVAALQAAGLRVVQGPIFSSRRPVVGAARGKVHGQSGALVAEMEALWFGRALPVAPAVIRVVSDGPGGERPAPLAAFRGFLEARRALRTVAQAVERHLAAGVAG